MTVARRAFLVDGLLRAAALAGTVPAAAAAAAAAAPAAGRPPPAAAPPADAAFAFALIGDTPYSRLEELRLQEVLERLGEDRLALVIHVGDIKSGRESCSDELIAQRHALLERSAHPLVLTPGDNDWADCHRSAAGGFDPIERLQRLRATFFTGSQTLGRKRLVVARQPGFPENVRWSVGPVAFVALHVIGSNDGIDGHAGGSDEWRARHAANRRWLDESVRQAQQAGADALVLAVHANPGFGVRLQPGHVPFRRLLVDAARRFAGPILFLHGDTHRFRVDRPLVDDDGRHYPQVTRVESFGSPFGSSWVRISYEPTLPERFVVTMRTL